jgi:two-component system, NarL family, nitrate/nitrite response regulator NarL
MTIRVLVADDNALFRDGMAQLLTAGDQIAVIGRAKDTAEVVRKASVLRPDVVLMDLTMPLGGGISATRQILAERPDQAICILTVSEQEHDLYAAIRAGARGYVLKTVSLAELSRAITVLATGGSVIAPRLAARLLRQFVTLSAAAPGSASELGRLTVREREVLGLVTLGAQNKDIADRLAISPHTVKVHLHNLLDKLELRNRRQAAAFAVQCGLVRHLHPANAAGVEDV